jgi:ParB-like chromosome segregation protein Spo0J
MEMRPGLSDEDKKELAQSLNEHRRHLTAQDRKELAARMKAEGKSNVVIAERLQVDEKTIRNDLSGSELSEADRIIGRDGKSYPAKRPTTIRVESVEEASVASALLGQLDSKPPEGTVGLEDLYHQRRKESPPPAKEATETKASIRWNRLFHDIYQQLNGIRDAGGVAKLTSR